MSRPVSHKHIHACVMRGSGMSSVAGAHVPKELALWWQEAYSKQWDNE